MDALEVELAAVAVGYWHARMGWRQVARRAAGGQVKRGREAAGQDTYMDIVGYRGSMGLERGWM
jgi:hypothetical protein